LEALQTVDDRRARYVCAAVYVATDREVVRLGATDGSVLREPRGAGGFGYDPYFLSDELGQTFGEASRFDKERVSHRGRAFRLLLTSLLG
jgi:XTP/dITP diphosphohydrolase